MPPTTPAITHESKLHSHKRRCFGSRTRLDKNIMPAMLNAASMSEKQASCRFGGVGALDLDISANRIGERTTNSASRRALVNVVTLSTWLEKRGRKTPTRRDCNQLGVCTLHYRQAPRQRTLRTESRTRGAKCCAESALYQQRKKQVRDER